MKEEMLVVENGKISKSGNNIIKELYLQIYKGEIFGIIFDNILEKESLLSFLKGDRVLCSGRIYLDNEKIDINDSPKHFVSSIAVIERTSKLIGSFDIATNVMLFTSYMQKYFVNNKNYACALEEIKKNLQININTNKPVSALSSKERVIVELIKAYAEKKKIIIMTDITGFLKSTEMMEIFPLIHRLIKSGMTFAIIESFKDIVFEYTDRLTIIRNGKTLGIYKPEDINKHHIYSALLRNQAKPIVSEIPLFNESNPETPQPALSFVNVSTEILKNINFTINKGKIVKILYLDDSSFTHIIELLKGIRKPLSGQIIVSDKEEYRISNVHQSVNKGVCFIEESPSENMIFQNMSILDNLCLSLGKKVRGLWRKKRYTKSVEKLVSRFISADITKVKLSSLSHVELQQLIYLKWLLYAPSVVICIKPFTEVDIQLRETTINMIEMLSQRGIAVIIFTSNISETYWVEGDTVYIRNGKIINEEDAHKAIVAKDKFNLY